MRLLTYTSLYPGTTRPRHGIFVENRLRRIVMDQEISARVVAPVPWVPPGLRRTANYKAIAETPDRETRFNIEITHPRWVAIPKYGMTVAPSLMARGSFGAVSRLLGDADFDLIDAHYFYPDAVAAASVARRFGKPFVVTARGSDINLIAGFRGPREKILGAASAASAVIAVSQALAVRMATLGVPAEKITVLPNGVDLEMFAPADRAAARRAVGLENPFILCVGNLVPEKGQDAVLRALPSLPPELDLVLAGEGPLRAGLESQAAALGIARRVHMLGNLPQDELPRFYNAAEMTVLASVREGMPNAILESLACATPVVATRVGGIPEIVRGPDCGVLLTDRTPASIADAVNGILADPPERQAIRAVALDFGWEGVIEAQRTLYRRVLETSSS